MACFDNRFGAAPEQGSAVATGCSCRAPSRQFGRQVVPPAPMTDSGDAAGPIRRTPPAPRPERLTRWPPPHPTCARPFAASALASGCEGILQAIPADAYRAAPCGAQRRQTGRARPARKGARGQISSATVGGRNFVPGAGVAPAGASLGRAGAEFVKLHAPVLLPLAPKLLPLGCRRRPTLTQYQLVPSGHP